MKGKLKKSFLYGITLIIIFRVFYTDKIYKAILLVALPMLITYKNVVIDEEDYRSRREEIIRYLVFVIVAVAIGMIPH